MDYLSEILKKYLDLDEKYRKYISQFSSVAWEGQKNTLPPKVFNKEEIEIIKRMRQERDDAHDEWFRVIRANG